MRCDDELHTWKGPAETPEYLDLPSRMQVGFDLVDKDGRTCILEVIKPQQQFPDHIDCHSDDGLEAGGHVVEPYAPSRSVDQDMVSVADEHFSSVEHED